MYLSWATETITDFSHENINAMYNRGFVFTRPTEGAMEQTRSMRVDLSQFELSSENRRILRKLGEVTLKNIPLPYADYSWEIGKMGKDFYETKFGDGTFSANKIKELLTDGRRDFNRLFSYADGQGYCIVVETDEIFHYSYPFYNLDMSDKSMGMAMMLTAILYAKEKGKKYIYLGSAQRPSDTYKLQFKGIEWFDGQEWSHDVDKLKDEL